MAREIRHYTATCPAGTPQTAPVTVDISFPPRIVREVYWRVPHGWSGFAGWQLAMGGVQVIPAFSDTWIVADDEHGTWAASDWPDSGAWQVRMYNTGIHPHSVYLAFSLDVITRPALVAPLLEGGALTGAPDLSRAGAPLPRVP